MSGFWLAVYVAIGMLIVGSVPVRLVKAPSAFAREVAEAILICIWPIVIVIGLAMALEGARRRR